MSTVSADGDARPSVTPTSTSTRTMHQFVLLSIREGILRGELRQGDPLLQSHLARDLHVSTTPVREALRDLVADGLVSFRPRRGYFVKQLDPTEIDEILEMRRALESLAMQRAAERITPSQIKIATSIYESMLEARDPRTWLGLNDEFHDALVEASDSTRLASTIRSLTDASIHVNLTVQLQSEVIDIANLGHKELLDAVVSHDPDRAGEQMLEHLELTSHRFHEIIDSMRSHI